MFNYIFQSYKTDTHNKALSQVIKKIILACIPVLVIGLSLFYFKCYWGVVLILLLLIISILVNIAYMDKQRKKERHTQRDEYLTSRIPKLKKVLEGENYNLHNRESIDWLIEQCDNMTGDSSDNKYFKDIFKAVFPIITLVLGVLLSELERQEIKMVIIAIIILVLCIFLYTAIEGILLGVDKRLAEELKIDLQYINMLLTNDKKEDN